MFSRLILLSYFQGCLSELEKYLRDHIVIVGGVGIGIAFIQVCNLICSCTVSIGHFTVMDGSESGVDLVLIQTFLFYYVNQVILMLTSIFQGQFP